MPFYVIKGDLINMNVDAIVNAANVKLKMVEGVGRAIFHKAGDKELTEACKKIGFCNVGRAVVTPSFNMTNCKMIIHAVGPNYINGKHNEEENLISAYKESLRLLNEAGLHTIAFPLLSGEFNYPLRDAYQVAYDTILNYLKTHKDDVIYLVMYKSFPELVDDAFQDDLTKYITSTYKAGLEKKDIPTAKDNLKLIESIRKFQKETNVNDEELIINGNLSQDLFDRLLGNSSFIPSKHVLLAFAIAMKLTKEKTSELFNSLGYEFNSSNILDLVVSYFMKEKIYDVYRVNNALFNYDILPLGADY